MVQKVSFPVVSGPFGTTREMAKRTAAAPRGVVIALFALCWVAAAFGAGSFLASAPTGPDVITMAEPVLAVRTPGIGAPEADPPPRLAMNPDPAIPVVPEIRLLDAHPVSPRPGTPEDLRIAAAVAEDALGLGPRQRRAVQQRLKLLGHDPGGVDGVFGTSTRAAIVDWQMKEGLVPTGFLAPEEHRLLRARYNHRLRTWRAQHSRLRRAEVLHFALIAPPPPPDRCARRSDGSVIGRRTLLCDLRGMGEGVVGFVKGLGTL